MAVLNMLMYVEVPLEVGAVCFLRICAANSSADDECAIGTFLKKQLDKNSAWTIHNCFMFTIITWKDITKDIELWKFSEL